MRDFLNKLEASISRSIAGQSFFTVLRFLHISDGIRSLVYFFEFLTDANIETKRYFSERDDDVAAVENLLADEFSLRSYRATIRFRCTSLRHDLLKIRRPSSEQYFDPLNIFASDESFVDCGAFTGDTIATFLDVITVCNGGGYENIYAFEPDPKNCKALEAFISSRNLQNVTVFPYATGKENGTAFFETASSVSSSSRLSYSINNAADIQKRNTIEVPVRALDSILKGRRISFIKMDIEGAETDTLLGASHIIQTQRPRLAICIYHSNSDMISIPLLIHKLVPDYKLYVRHYSDTWIETVLYAIP